MSRRRIWARCLPRDRPASLTTDAAIRLRIATPEDAPPLGRIWFEAWHSVRSADTDSAPFPLWVEKLRNRVILSETVVLAERAGESLGFMALRFLETEALLHLMYVAPSAHRQGVGSMLLDDVKRRAPRGFRLYTLRDNTGARRFYESHGLIIGKTFRQRSSGEIYLSYSWAPTR